MTDEIQTGTDDADEIRRRKEIERGGRDAGAKTYLARLRASRGEFRWRAEELALLDLLALRPEWRVLDAGAGVGRYALQVAPRVREVVCVDFSQPTLDELAAEAERRGLRNVTTHRADLTELGDGLGRFHMAMSFEVLQHLPTHEERLKAVRAIRAVLEPRGRFVFSGRAANQRVRELKDSHNFTTDELRDLLERGGFRVLEFRGLIVLPGVITRGWPAALAPLERMLSRLPGSERMGRLLAAAAERVEL